MRQLPSAALLDHSAESPIVLVGEPRKLTGRVQLHNRADSRVVLREARLCGAPVGPRSRAALGGPVPELTVPMTAILAPDQKQQVRVRVAIDAHTPPGSYRADMRVGDHAHPVELHVAESVALSVSPDVVVVENRHGARIHKRIVLTNDGNVPLVVGNIGAVVLDEELIACKTIRAMLVDGDESAQTVDQWISAYFRQGKRQLDAIGMLWVEVEGAPLTLKPGEVRPVDLSIRVPDSLDPRSRYHGVAFLYETNISFTVAPTGVIKGHGPDVVEIVALPTKPASARKSNPRRKK